MYIICVICMHLSHFQYLSSHHLQNRDSDPTLKKKSGKIKHKMISCECARSKSITLNHSENVMKFYKK